jgi:hypothetical protein
MEQTPQNNTPPSADAPKVPARPPTERERRDTAIRFLSSLIQNTMISEEQGELFPELKVCLEKVATVGRECLKDLL